MILLSIVELFKGEGQRQWEACLPHGEGGEVGENCAENSHLCLNATPSIKLNHVAAQNITICYKIEAKFGNAKI